MLVDWSRLAAYVLNLLHLLYSASNIPDFPCELSEEEMTSPLTESLSQPAEINLTPELRYKFHLMENLEAVTFATSRILALAEYNEENDKLVVSG